MGIQYEVTLYGATVARALAHEPEELAYALEELLTFNPKHLAAQVAECAPFDVEEMVAWFETFASSLNGDEEEGDE